MYDLYPEIDIGFLRTLNVMDEKNYVKERGQTIASTSFIESKVLGYGFYNISTGLELMINSDLFDDLDLLNSNLKIINETNQKIDFVISHEFGHIIDIFWSLKEMDWRNQKYITAQTISNFLNNLNFSDCIVERAFLKRYKQYEIDINDIVKEIGINAINDKQEIFAESIALGYCNINSPLSLTIIKEYNKEIGKDN